ncbi:MAG: NAD(P)H-binding protein [Gammaproteobacteria bacterium]|nr:NAD(P)H-binding protein [Gammaproteobacteria bacterium]
MTNRILLTGANGHLGRLVIRALADDADALPVRAVVRSENAARSLDDLPSPERREVRIIDYRDRTGLEAAAQGCDAAIHLVGILKATRANRYESAHEQPAEALSAACSAAGVGRIVHTSIHGADPASGNGCLASRGRTDDILLASPVPAVILRVPMVLGPGDMAAEALRRQATSGRARCRWCWGRVTSPPKRCGAKPRRAARGWCVAARPCSSPSPPPTWWRRCWPHAVPALPPMSCWSWPARSP